ncbi:TniB family NTP-binding protein [Streptomyces sp. CC208A]|uniref:TniB family NTP-binding protein n=1 Tax=Streptomyces sp. CC208A TaxID=3044573 RepID=UPI0024A8F98F|nr:TniB family NTP-binding protein [Streptomyces sp. CC208A]
MAPPPGDDGECLHPGLAEPRTKEDWFTYVFYDPPSRPLLPPYEVYLAMDDAERRRLNRTRNRYHSALVLAWTPAVQHFETEITELLAANEMAPPGARLGLLIDGPPTVGKSTLVKMIARKFEQELREDFPERFAPERLGSYVPVVYISLTDQVTPKQISLAIARYLNVPTSGTKDIIDDRVLTALTASGTQLIIFDDLHFLDCAHKEGRASNDHIKFLANHAPCTIVGTGVDLENSPLLSEGGPAVPRRRSDRTRTPAPTGSDARTQTAGRFSRQELAPFTLDNDDSILQWVGVIRSLESSLALYQHEKESLTRRHWRYLHERTDGSIAGLHALIRRSAVRAVQQGTEAITQEIMDSIVLSYAHERAYAKVTELKSRQTTRAAKQKQDGKRAAADGSA